MQRPSLPLLATVAIFCCLEFLQTGMMAFAAAPIMGEIDASPEEYSLIGVFYACVAVIVIAKMQWAVERIGWRSYVLATVALYIIGAAVCGISSDATSFGIGRIIMACGGGGFMAMSRVLISHIAPGPGRFTGIRVFAVALATGSASAPLLASVSVTSDHWQMMFWILGGLALVGAVMAASFLPNQVEPSDVRSQSNAGQILLLALGSFIFLYALQRSYYDFYNDDLIIIAFLILALGALLIFVRYEQREDRSLFRMRELRTTRYVTGVILFAFSYVLLGANNYVLPFFLQRGLGYSWPTLGLFQSLGLLASLATWLIMSPILPKFPAPRKFFVLGFGALALFGWILSSLTPQAAMWTDVLPALLCHGCFIMLVLATTAMQTFRDVGRDDELHTHAQQVKNMAAQLSTAFGVSFATVFLQWRTTVQYDHLGVRLNFSDPIFAASHNGMTAALSASVDASTAAQMAMAQQAQQVAQQATMLAGVEYFWMIAIVAIVALLVSAAQRIFR